MSGENSSPWGWRNCKYLPSSLTLVQWCLTRRRSHGYLPQSWLCDKFHLPGRICLQHPRDRRRGCTSISLSNPSQGGHTVWVSAVYKKENWNSGDSQKEVTKQIVTQDGFPVTFLEFTFLTIYVFFLFHYSCFLSASGPLVWLSQCQELALSQM